MPRSNIIIISVIFFCSFGFSVERTLTWSECQTLAKANNKELQIAREKINSLVLQKNITETTARPQISGGASIGESASAESGSKDPGLFDKDNINDSKSLSVSGKQLLYDWNKTSQNIAIAKEKIENQKYNYQITEANLRLTLRQYFCAVLRSQKMIELNKAILSRRQQQYELLKLRYNAGLEHKGSLLTAEANLKQALNQTEQEARDLETNIQKLNYLMGVTANNTYLVTDDLELKTDLAQTPEFGTIVEATPVLKEVVSRRIQNKYSIENAKADYLPEVYLSGSLGKNFSTRDNKTTQSDSWSIGANLSFTLWDGNKKGLTTEITESTLRQTELELAQNRQNIALTMQQTWNDLKNATDSISVYNVFLKAAEERATIAGAQYTSGLISFDNWIIIEDNLISAQKNYLNGQIESLNQEAKWINAKGGVLDEK